MDNLVSPEIKKNPGALCTLSKGNFGVGSIFCLTFQFELRLDKEAKLKQLGEEVRTEINF